jgi:hypothetical protein
MSRGDLHGASLVLIGFVAVWVVISSSTWRRPGGGCGLGSCS